MSHDPSPDSRTSEPASDVRRRLRELGYLDNSVARFVAGSDTTSALSIAGVILRAAFVGWLGLLVLTLGATLAVNPFLLQYPIEVAYLVLGLALASLVLALCVAVVFGLLFLAFLPWARRHRQMITGLASLVPLLSATLLFAYLTFWWAENSAYGTTTGLLSLRNLGFSVVAVFLAWLFYRVTQVVFLALVLRHKDGFPDHQRGRRGRLRLATFAALAFAGFFAFLFGTNAGGEGPDAGESRPERAVSDTPGVAVLGIEGPDPATLRLLMAEGHMPTLTALAEAGVMMDLEVVSEEAPEPVVVWTTLATGVPPDVHGIMGFEDEIPAGLRRHIEVSEQHVGVYQILKIVLPALKLTHTIPYSSDYRRALAMWEIASEAGMDAGVVNWWASWPPDDVRGFFVTDRDFMQAAQEAEMAESHQSDQSGQSDQPALPMLSPSALYQAAVAEAAADLEAIVPGSELSPDLAATLENALAMDAFHAASGRVRYRETRPELYALFLQGVDVIENALHSRQQSVLRQSEILTRCYDLLDRRIGEQIEFLEPGTMILVCVMPGLNPPEGSGDGVLLVARKGETLEGLNNRAGQTLDLTPTVLALVGIPPTQQMPGRVLPFVGDLFPEQAALGDQRPERYPRRLRPVRDRLSAIQDEAYLTRLKTLGYISGE